MNTMIDDSVKYAGTTGWANPDAYAEAEIERAILRKKNQIVLEFHSENFRYTVTLRRHTDNEFRGTFQAARGGAQETGKAECKILLSGSDALLLGTWDELGESYQWWAALRQVEHFRDEQPQSYKKGSRR
jgi:hypothetical protein